MQARVSMNSYFVGAGGGGWEWGGRHFSRETVLCRCIYVGTADSTLARHILIG